MGGKPYTKMSLIERSALTFESFLNQDFGNRFYQSEFLDGISARRMEVTKRIGKGAGQAFLLATVLAFFDLISGSSFTYGGLTLQITKDLTPIISLLTAGALLNTTFAFIDDQILFRILLKIGNHIKIQHFQLLLVDKMAHNPLGGGRHCAQGIWSEIWSRPNDSGPAVERCGDRDFGRDVPLSSFYDRSCIP
jgi:hypothetical protein